MLSQYLLYHILALVSYINIVSNCNHSSLSQDVLYHILALVSYRIVVDVPRYDSYREIFFCSPFDMNNIFFMKLTMQC